jgi:hypothetical protein
MFADSGAKAPAGLGTRTPEQVGRAVVKAIERDKVEIAVAPMQARIATHLAAISPSIGVRAQIGSAGQKAAEAIAEGHETNAPQKR